MTACLEQVATLVVRCVTDVEEHDVGVRGLEVLDELGQARHSADEVGGRAGLVRLQMAVDVGGDQHRHRGEPVGIGEDRVEDAGRLLAGDGRGSGIACDWLYAELRGEKRRPVNLCVDAEDHPGHGVNEEPDGGGLVWAEESVAGIHCSYFVEAFD